MHFRVNFDPKRLTATRQASRFQCAALSGRGSTPSAASLRTWRAPRSRWAATSCWVVIRRWLPSCASKNSRFAKSRHPRLLVPSEEPKTPPRHRDAKRDLQARDGAREAGGERAVHRNNRSLGSRSTARSPKSHAPSFRYQPRQSSQPAPKSSRALISTPSTSKPSRVKT